MTRRKTGRLPRAFDPAMPHMAAIRMMARAPLPSIPEEQHWAAGMPSDLGMMLNDQLGDCTCAGAYHAMQVWSYHGRPQMLTEPDADVLRMYEEFCGYRPDQPGTDQGGVEQDVLRQWMTRGAPIVEGSHGAIVGRSKLISAMEVDPKSPEQIKRAIYDCGAVYAGIMLPAAIGNAAELPELWGYSGQNSVGGHCVILTGYDSQGNFDIVSWGGKYRITPEFWAGYADEAYALVHPWWIAATGMTPYGLPLTTLEAQMPAFCSTSLPQY